MINWQESLYSDGSKYFVSNPLPKKGEEIEIKIRIHESAPIKKIILRTKLNGVDRMIPMEYDSTRNKLVYYKANIICYEDILNYKFYIATEDRIYYYNQRGVTDYIPNDVYDFKIIYNYEQPTWVKKAVFYQIFPDRFFNGNEKNDVVDGEYTFDGYKTIKVKDFNSIPKEYEEVHCLDFYGGDLEGIKKKIPYLKKLGVTALYLNPIFYAATVHKYDCLDFFTVDPHFGGDKALAELTEELHKNDMKIILDVSINHTGIANKWFNRDGDFFDKKIGAYNNKNSEERSYYFFNEDNSYKAWFDVETLPTLNYTSLELRNIIYKGKDSFIKKFLKEPYNIDGWRFDVADTMGRNDYIQLHHEIWPEIRRSIKEENKEAYILAEDWSECQEFLRGNEWDSPMNYYGCSRAIREFLKEGDLFNRRNPYLQGDYDISASVFINRIKDYLGILAFSIQENQFNLINSHDVPRLHNNKKISYDNLKLAVTVMFTLIGTPNIYYGDEILLDGRTNTTEGCRYPMRFIDDLENNKTYQLYHKLSLLKQNEKALNEGGIKFFESKDKVFGYARIALDDVIIVVGSNDTNEVEFLLPIYALGKELLPEFDEFKNKLDYKVCHDGVILNVKPYETYLIKL